MSDNDAPPTISYTRKRTTTKTRTAATSARRRKNIPLCHASGGDNPDGKDQHSWFARKSVGWTDEEIKNHVVSGGVSNGGKSFSMVGDVILGASSSTSMKDKKKKKKRRGKQFAWEEDDEEDIEDGGSGGRIMTAADIMDEQDEVDFMAPVKVSKSYQMKSSANTDNNIQDDNAKSANNGSKSRRRQNAALDELAQVCGNTSGSNSRIQPTSANESIGWRLLRVLGYRSRLGMAFVPLAGHVGGLDSIDNNEVKELGNGKHEAKWLASKRLRAIYLPSIQNVDDSKNSTDVTKRDKKKIKVLTIPPPKVNRHGIGFDPFKNAPEFRKFHERRQELAKKQGRATEDDTARGNNRYSTDNLKDGRQALWDKARSDVGKDSEDEMSDPGIVKSHHQSSSHYAADRDYTDFIGTKASSGFALHDEDDANVYQDGEGRRDNGDGGEYTTEINSPVASEDEDDDNGLFGKAAIIEKKSKASERGMKGVEDSGKVAADAWSAWGIGESPAVKRTTMDGKPPLSGFALAASTDSQAKSDAPKRWKGPIVPSGYVLQHHVFTKEEDDDIKESVVDGNSGLGLDLQRRQEQQPSRSLVPNVLPPSRMQPPPPPDGKMLSRGGNEMNFHAVKESMKNRFTSAAEITTANTSESEVNDGNNSKQDMDEEEWVTVEVSTWLPTRLLCKRWGITAPSTVGVSETGKGGMVQSKEENYFRQTIMAEHPDGGSSNTKTPATSNSKTTADSGMQVDNFLGDDDQEDIAPPPERPSDAVFQSIFNAESDMDISSDDDNESDEDDLDTTRAEDEKESKKESAASVDRSHLSQTNGSLADIKPKPADQYNNDLLPAADSTDSDSESSGSSKHRRKRRKSKSDERKRHRRSDSDEEDRRRRKKKKHKRSKHKKSRY